MSLLLRNFRSECPQRAEMVPNRGIWNGAVVPAVEAVTVERRDDPHGSPFDFVGAIWPRIERPLQVVAESSCAVGKQLSIDSNSICAYLHFVSGKCDAWFEKRRSAIGASPCGAILAGGGEIKPLFLLGGLQKVFGFTKGGGFKNKQVGGGGAKAGVRNPAPPNTPKKK